MICMASALRDLIDEKMDRGGADALAHGSLRGFLTESGHRLDRAGMMRVVRELAHADARRYLPVVAGALAGLADDSDEFAGLVARMSGGARGGPLPPQFAGALADLGATKPGMAVRLARRLIRAGAAHPAAHLAGGAWRAEPAKCASIADTLVRSAGGQEAAAGIISMRVARVRHGIADVPAWIKSLSSVASRPDGAAAADAMDALVDIYPLARAEAGPMIEDLAGRHASCRSRLAARIGLHSSPFDVDTAKRYLTVCAGGDLDPQYADSIHMALAELAKRDCDAAVRIAARRVLGGEYPGNTLGYALQEIGRADPGGLVVAILDKAASCHAPVRDMSLAYMICDIAKHADPEAVLAPLFGELGRDGPAARPALCMIKGMVTLSHDTMRGGSGGGLAASMLGRLASYAQARGIDAEYLAKKEQCVHLKCAAIIDRLLHPPPNTDGARALQNLGMFPSLKRAFKPEWIKARIADAAASGRAAHPLAVALSIPPPEKARRFLEEAAPEEAPGMPSGREDGPVAGPATVESPAPPTQHESIALESLVFLDRALASIEAAGRHAAGYAKKMKNPDQFPDTISELGLVVPFAACHKVEIEPPAGEKRLDAAIELGPQRVLVEVLGLHMLRELDLLSGGRGIQTDRVAGKIFDKAKWQIPPLGTCSDPVVVAVDTGRSEATWDDVKEYVLGPRACEAEYGRDAGKGTGCAAAARNGERSMHQRDCQTDSISAVVCFELDMSAGPAGAIRGAVIEKPHAAVPLCPEARDALAAVLEGARPGGGRYGGGE